MHVNYFAYESRDAACVGVKEEPEYLISKIKYL